MSLPRAVIVDVDGTLALRDNTDPDVRHFSDWTRVGEDHPHPAIVELVRVLAAAGYLIVVMSGRDEICRWQTEMWMHAQHVPFDELHMRTRKDNRADTVVKKELYEQHVAGKYDVAFVIDDRNTVVAQWRAMGLTCLQVADGDF